MSINLEFAGNAEFAKMLDNHPKQVGYAYRNAVNNTVYEIQKYAQDHLSDNFTERNAFTRRGIVFTKGQGFEIENVEAAVGAAANRPWMKKQEQGFETKGAQGTENVRVSGSYKRAIQAKKYIKGAQVRTASLIPNKAKTPHGKIRAMLAISYRNGYGYPGTNQFFYFKQNELFSNQQEGYYQFDNSGAKMHGKQSSTEAWYPNIVLAYRLNNERYVKSTPWLEDAVKARGTPEAIWQRFETQLQEQLKRFS